MINQLSSTPVLAPILLNLIFISTGFPLYTTKEVREFYPMLKLNPAYHENTLVLYISVQCKQDAYIVLSEGEDPHTNKSYLLNLDMRDRKSVV